MKVKFLPSILLFSAAALLASFDAVYAQDKGLAPSELADPSHSELNLSDDKTLLTDSAQVHARPTAAVPLSAKSKSPEQKDITSKEEDDALSFNFLYYIIQKFKISDLIDE